MIGGLLEPAKAHEFQPFPKLARLSRECVVTEKIDGTNAQVYISDDLQILKAGSRTRWLTPEQDNYGFCRWVLENAHELLKLGPGRHFGEWWGSGIQRGYGLTNGDKRFSLFNTARWVQVGQPQGEKQATAPACCHVVPVLYRGWFDTRSVMWALENLRTQGSQAAVGFMKPEGVVVRHDAARVGFKKTLENDEKPKGQIEQ